MPATRPAPAPVSVDGSGSIMHLHTADEPEKGLCGALLRGVTPRPGADPCAVCLDLARRGFVDR
jgi:hypothetical protein